MKMLKTLIAALFVTFVGSNMAMNEKEEIKIQKKWIPEEVDKLDESVIREILDGPVDVAAQLVKDAAQYGRTAIFGPEDEFSCKPFFVHVTEENMYKITLYDKKCAEIFLKYGRSNFASLRQIEEFQKICIDTVHSDNIAAVSANLWLVINNKKSDKSLIHKLAAYINTDNITDIDEYLLMFILRSDASSVDIIAQKAIRPESIKKITKKRHVTPFWNGSSGPKVSILDMLLETNIDSEDLIIKNAITEENSKKYLSKIKKSVERSKELLERRELRLREEVSELLEQAKQTPKEQWSTINEEAAKKILSGPQDLAEKFVEIAHKKGATNNLIESVKKDEECINTIKRIEQQKMIVSKL